MLDKRAYPAKKSPRLTGIVIALIDTQTKHTPCSIWTKYHQMITVTGTSTMTRITILLLTMMTVGCHPAQNYSGTAQLKTEANTFKSAKEAIIKTKEYIPFEIMRTGCDQRAYYLSLELAVRGIPSSHYYAYAKHGSKIMPEPTITWEYHVAPLITAYGMAIIVDPALASLEPYEEVLSLENWKKLLKTKKQGFWRPEHGAPELRPLLMGSQTTFGQGHRTAVSAASVALTTGSEAHIQWQQEQIQLQSPKSIEPYRVSDISSTCRDIKHIFKSDNKGDDMRITKMENRSYELMAALKNKGLLLEDIVFSCD